MQKQNNNNGQFVISIDYELLWGVWDVTTKEKYGQHILGVRKVIPALIDLFETYHIKTTFAIVGFLFAKNKEELLPFLPEIRPNYLNNDYDVYGKEFRSIGNNEEDDPYHFGYSMFQLIRNSNHEIGTHTFCHYYCMEEGQTEAEFDADIKAAKKIAAANGIDLISIVFPRNQLNTEYLAVLKNNGILVYRGNPTSWIYKPRKFSAEIPFIRLCRLLDTYFPISGYNTHSIDKNDGFPVNIPACHFLKPYNKKLAWLEKLKLARIKKEMTIAAQKGKLFHLWWHPHNFGININENIANLKTILDHFVVLNKEYGFANLTMKEAAGL